MTGYRGGSRSQFGGFMRAVLVAAAIYGAGTNADATSAYTQGHSVVLASNPHTNPWIALIWAPVVLWALIILWRMLRDHAQHHVHLRRLHQLH